MTVTRETEATTDPDRTRPPGSAPVPPPVDRQRMYRLVLATVWLLDALLQLQPVMFARDANGLSGMLHDAAAGDPGWVARSISWSASIVNHQPIVTNTAFAAVQFLIAVGIVYRRTCQPALALSIVWSLAVWWFGEGLGRVLTGAATPFGGGPGGVLFYAVLAVLLWPSEGSDRPFVAARTVGVGPAKAVWAVMWLALAVLSVVGSGRSPRALDQLVAGVAGGEPGWLARIDRSTESLFQRHGTTVAVLLCVVCLLVAVGAYLPPRWTQLSVVLAVVVFALVAVAVQDLGGILAGGATDPNAAPLVVLIALIYWPLTTREGDVDPGAGRAAPESRV